MKWFKIAKDLKINVESIYALAKENNDNEINEWEQTYNTYVENIYNNPVELVVDGKVCLPNFKETIDESLLNKYMEALKVYILSMIGEKPELKENYFTILTTGSKVYLTKEVYDIINQYIEDNFDIDVYKKLNDETEKNN